ncbi:MAG: 4-hydroxybenzoate octaprenyltransferase [Gammaproteobacteria bacterium]|nr:4-hydroxybenzoate octaprenyltransferase [Gammaproteobacteria bacterium]
MDPVKVWPRLQHKLPDYIKLTRLNRPIGAFLLLWPTLWALWLASSGKPDLKILAIFIVGTWLTRSAGCAINDFADRDIDKHIRRTRDRPLTSGRVSAAEALVLAAVLMLLAFLLVLLTNGLTILLSFVALFLASVYPFMKRYTHFPQIVLGAAFAIAVPMAFAAQTGSVPMLGWQVFIAAVIWAVAYDTFYAMADREDDIKVGVKSTAIFFGHYDLAVIAFAQVCMLGIMLVVGIQAERGALYFFGLAIALGIAIVQLYVTRHRDADKCFWAFLNNHYLGMVIFLGLSTDYLLHEH